MGVRKFRGSLRVLHFRAADIMVQNYLLKSPGVSVGQNDFGFRWNEKKEEWKQRALEQGSSQNDYIALQGWPLSEEDLAATGA